MHIIGGEQRQAMARSKIKPCEQITPHRAPISHMGGNPEAAGGQFFQPRDGLIRTGAGHECELQAFGMIGEII
jgi:hypothetical protein